MKKPTPKPLHLDDLPLPEAQIAVLKAITRAAGVRKRCQLCLFIGPRGSGKALVAMVLANELERPLHRMKLAAVIGRSTGETEKHLAAVLEKAQAAEAVLFFDEADALFAKRSKAKSSKAKKGHDRYANQDVSYLLAAVEAYHGLVILSDNLEVATGSPLSGRPAHVLTFDR